MSSLEMPTYPVFAVLAGVKDILAVQHTFAPEYTAIEPKMMLDHILGFVVEFFAAETEHLVVVIEKIRQRAGKEEHWNAEMVVGHTADLEEC